MLAITLLHILVDIPALICEYFYVDKENELTGRFWKIFNFWLFLKLVIKVHYHAAPSICPDEVNFARHWKLFHAHINMYGRISLRNST